MLKFFFGKKTKSKSASGSETLQKIVENLLGADSIQTIFFWLKKVNEIPPPGFDPGYTGS